MMRQTVMLLSGMLMVGLLAGCACTTAAKPGAAQTETLRDELQQLSAHVSGLESSQREIQNELRTLTGLQEGLRQQMEGLAKQRPAAEPDEK